MTNDFYHGIIKNLHVGYAYHRIICDTQGTPVDYEFIEVNRAFEAATGLIGAEIIGKTVTAVIPEIRDSGLTGFVFMVRLHLIIQRPKSSNTLRHLTAGTGCKSILPKRITL